MKNKRINTFPLVMLILGTLIFFGVYLVMRGEGLQVLLGLFLFVGVGWGLNQMYYEKYF